MDNLTADVLAAERAGMSYGKWKAMHPHTKKVEPALIVGDIDPFDTAKRTFTRVCRVCRRTFITDNGRRLSCSDECAKAWDRAHK